MATLCGRSFTSCLGFAFLLLFVGSSARKHHINLKHEQRKTIGLSKFGFLVNGVLTIEVDSLEVADKSKKYGFSLEKTASDGISPYMEQNKEECILENPKKKEDNHISVVLFTFNFQRNRIEIMREGKDFDSLEITNGTQPKLTTTASAPATKPHTVVAPSTAMAPSTATAPPTATVPPTTTARVPTSGSATPNANNPSSNVSIAVKSLDRSRRQRGVQVENLPLIEKKQNKTFFYTKFEVHMKNKVEEGLYNLYFHNCYNFNPEKGPVAVTMTVHITEKNGDKFLSAGEEPLPYLCGAMGVIFFLTAFFWLYILRKNKDYTFKVHYMMFVLVLLKAMDNMFQAVDFHFINKEGTPMKAWAVLYYIAHLLKGALLFTTIVLIGTGFFFIKHVLSKKEKKIFLIVIPLQILANTAQIVMESTEAAATTYATWNEIFILVDLLCCGAILFPVVWSIRHLQEASQTDGKAALSLTKLKLFRHFYVMIVCYIYFTRIIVYLVKITVPFQYMWLNEFFKNIATFVFFVMTGYKFSPAPDNPYLHLPQDDTDEEEVEMDEVVTSGGAASRVTKLQQRSGGGETA